MKLLGANPAPRVEGLEELPGKSNYFIGKNPAKWRTHVPHYARVHYRDVYPGVDLVYYGKQHQIEHDFLVAPGADPRQIRFQVTGAGMVELDSRGELVIHVTGGEMRLRKPTIYQEEVGARKKVVGGYTLTAGNRVGFALGAYDPTKRLVIDPVLVYSTYLGGSDFDRGLAPAVDHNGNVYVTGQTSSTNFPTTNPLQPAPGGGLDVFVTKLNATGSALIYSTYLGGSGSEMNPGVAVDPSGNAYVAGRTFSTDFPTANSLQPARAGGNDAFVAKLNAAGSALIYSTYLGGSGDENIFGIAADAAGNSYVSGWTTSPDLPTANPLQLAHGGGITDAFVAKLNDTGSVLVYSTYLGGSGEDRGDYIVVDAAGNAYMTGWTASPNFPTVNPLQETYGGGGFDIFAAKIALEPEQAIEVLIAEVTNLVNSGVLNHAEGNALIARLEHALEHLSEGKTKAAMNQLRAFANQVNAFIRAQMLSPVQGERLIFEQWTS